MLRKKLWQLDIISLHIVAYNKKNWKIKIHPNRALWPQALRREKADINIFLAERFIGRSVVFHPLRPISWRGYIFYPPTIAAPVLCSQKKSSVYTLGFCHNLCNQDGMCTRVCVFRVNTISQERNILEILHLECVHTILGKSTASFFCEGQRSSEERSFYVLLVCKTINPLWLATRRYKFPKKHHLEWIV